MNLHDVKNLIHARVICGEDLLDTEVHSACGSDMMSDVLAYFKEQAVLLTGLCNPQAIRTAMMMDIVCVVFVRDKKPTEDMVKMAEDAGIVLMTTGHRMFMSCGLLYEGGLRGGSDYERLH